VREASSPQTASTRQRQDDQLPTNYLLNALTAMAAEDKGGALGIGVDTEGNVTEQATACVAFLCKDDGEGTTVLRCPPFAPILEGSTLRRAIELAQPIPGVFSGRVDLHSSVPALETLRSCTEVISFGGGAVLPIVSVDVSAITTKQTASDSPDQEAGKSKEGEEEGEEDRDVIVIGDGSPGPLFRALSQAMANDFEDSPFLDDVPYK